MCSIDKLLIKGIRSFSPDNTDVIEFYRPLTLIVGQNGAGKTTIIECLKQACTGEMPPNTRSGQSFIHDPKVLNVQEVKAQIRLRIRIQQNAPVVIIRSFQLTQKKTALQFKAIDQVLQTFHPETNERSAISYRCAEIDKLVPHFMGVSKAVLENVIFVHQEDSNWPLAEGLILKRKFDDIFSATKYTKALEALRKLRTEKSSEIKAFRLAHDHTKTHKDMAAKLKKEIGENKQRMTELAGQKSSLIAQLQDLNQEARSLDSKLSGFAAMQSQLEVLSAQLREKVTANSQTRARLTATGRITAEEFDTLRKEELQHHLADMHSELSLSRSKLSTLGRRVDSKTAELSAINRQQRQTEGRQAQLRAQAAMMQRSKEQRHQFLTDASAAMGIALGPGEGELSEEQVAAFKKAFESMIDRQKTALGQNKASGRSREEEVARLINAATAELMGVDENLRLREQQCRDSAAASAQLQAQVDRTHVTAADLEEAEEYVEAAAAKEHMAQATLERLNAPGERSRLEGELAVVQSETARLREVRSQLAAAGEAATKAKLKRRELTRRQAAVEEAFDEASPRLMDLLSTRGTGLPGINDLSAAVDHVVHQREAALTSAQQQVQLAATALSGQKATAEAARQQLARLQQEAATLQQRLHSQKPATLSQATQGDEELPAMVSSAQHLLNTTTGHIEFVRAIGKAGESYKAHAQNHGECQACQRPLTAAELPAFLAHQDETIQEAPQRMKAFEEERARLQRHMDQLQALQPVYARLGTLETADIPVAQSEVDAAQAAAEEGERRLQKRQAPLPDLTRAVEEARELAKGVVAQLDTQAAFVAQLERECRAADNAAGADDLGGRTVVDVDADVANAEDKQRRLQTEYNQLTDRAMRLQGEVALASRAHNACREQLASKQAVADKRANLKAQISSHSASVQMAKAEVIELRGKKPALEERRREHQQARQTIQREVSDKEAQLDDRFQDLRSRYNSFLSIQAQVQQFLDEHIEDGLAEAAAALERSVHLQDTLRTEIDELRQEKDRIQKTVDNSAQSNSDVQELLGWKEGKEAEDEVSKQMAALESRIAEVGDVAAVDARYREVKAMAQKVDSDRHRIDGSNAIYQEGLSRSQRDLAQQVYRDIDGKYRRQLIELRTTEMANSDLDKYHKALEKALLAFHTAKMCDINKTIKELWQKTYRNQDIDYIQVKADSEGVGARSYNYRVVMMAGGAELDMRGRCSAGQKVLACLLIRLALAETFCLACGILALDEPTTNLDAANSASLAGALRAVIDSRRGQHNFQLIVITHDELFAQMIGTREHAVHRWRISKDDNQNSKITQEAIDS